MVYVEAPRRSPRRGPHLTLRRFDTAVTHVRPSSLSYALSQDHEITFAHIGVMPISQPFRGSGTNRPDPSVFASIIPTNASTSRSFGTGLMKGTSTTTSTRTSSWMMGLTSLKSSIRLYVKCQHYTPSLETLEASFLRWLIHQTQSSLG